MWISYESFLISFNSAIVGEYFFYVETFNRMPYAQMNNIYSRGCFTDRSIACVMVMASFSLALVSTISRKISTIQLWFRVAETFPNHIPIGVPIRIPRRDILHFFFVPQAKTPCTAFWQEPFQLDSALPISQVGLWRKLNDGKSCAITNHAIRLLVAWSFGCSWARRLNENYFSDKWSRNKSRVFFVVVTA